MNEASQAARPKRDCYCGSIQPDALAALAARGLPPGYCDFCERCGKPGHMQHFPGPIPTTGSWCDRCLRIVAWTWPLRNPVVWFAAIVAVLVVLLR